MCNHSVCLHPLISFKPVGYIYPTFIKAKRGLESFLGPKSLEPEEETGSTVVR